MDAKAPTSLSEFMSEIRRQYASARKPVYENEHLERGRSRTISGISEDLLASLLQSALQEYNLHYFIDQPLNCDGKFFYPDVCICKDNGEQRYTILYMIDLKTNVGYHRDVPKMREAKSTYKDKAEELTEICRRMKQGKIHAVKASPDSPDGKENLQLHFDIQQDAGYDMVIITSKNTGSQELEKKLIDLSAKEDSNIWVLDTGDDPNQKYGEPKFRNNEKDWQTLLKKIKATIK